MMIEAAEFSERLVSLYQKERRNSIDTVIPTLREFDKGKLRM
jgi:hypothetical protein